MALDEYITLAITQFTLGSITVQAIAVIAASVLIWLLIIWYLIVALEHKKAEPVELSALVVGGAALYLFNLFVSLWWWRPRPFLTLNIDPAINIAVTSKSFPSDHAALAFFLAFLLTRYKKTWWWAYLLASLVALGRVAVGVHYPLDVIAGACVGIMMGFFTEQFEKLFSKDKIT